jgi:TetR/AcrR family transcriptional repressor of nem operon
VRVTREQAEANREKVLHAAGTLFRQHGFDGVGVAEIMKRAGLTHGGFYGQFPSKDLLAAEACERVLADDDWLERLAGTARPTSGAAIRGYLSTRHRDDPGHGCLLAAVGSDVPRQPRPIRRAFTDGLRRRLDALLSLMPGRSPAARRRKALTTLAGLVGALELARAVDDAELSNEILESTATELARYASSVR